MLHSSDAGDDKTNSNMQAMLVKEYTINDKCVSMLEVQA